MYLSDTTLSREVRREETLSDVGLLAIICSAATSIHIYTETLQLCVVLLHTTRNLSSCPSTIHSL